MDHNIKHDLDYQLISDILCQQDSFYQLTAEVVVYLNQKDRKDYLLESTTNETITKKSKRNFC